MPTIASLLHGLPQRRPIGVPTGLAELDDLTGGLSPGRVWMLLGTSGAGRSILAGQIALHAAAVAHQSAVLLVGREEPQTVAMNLVSARSGVPARHLAAGILSESETVKVDKAIRGLQDAPLSIWCPADGSWSYEGATCTSDFNVLRDKGRPGRVLVVDDVDLLLDVPLTCLLPALRDWSRRADFTLVLTLPEEGLVVDGRVDATLRRNADVVLRLSRPDHFEQAHRRMGEADLDVLSHHDGPTAQIRLAFGGFCRRFTDLPKPAW